MDNHADVNAWIVPPRTTFAVWTPGQCSGAKTRSGTGLPSTSFNLTTRETKTAVQSALLFSAVNYFLYCAEQSSPQHKNNCGRILNPREKNCFI